MPEQLIPYSRRIVLEVIAIESIIQADPKGAQQLISELEDDIDAGDGDDPLRSALLSLLLELV